VSDLKHKLARWETVTVFLLIASILYGTSTSEDFLTLGNLNSILSDISEIALIALPLTLVIIAAEIDLSVASVLGLTCAVMGYLWNHGWAMEMIIPAVIILGGLAGALNGVLITKLGLPSLAVTIGTLALYRGIAVGTLGTKAVTDFPQKWTDLAKQHIGGSSYPVIMIPFVVLAILFALLLHFTSFGRGVYDIGLNDEAAHFTGVNVARTKFILFVLSGAVSAFAGIYITLRYGSARGDNATGLELQVIAAVLLGGVSIFGGRGALHGVIAGVLLIGVISSALRLEDVTVNVINIIIGLLLVLSVMSTSFLSLVTRASAGMKKRSSTSSDVRQLASAHHEGKN
jgi:rhamnose transport system permease protein